MGHGRMAFCRIIPDGEEFQPYFFCLTPGRLGINSGASAPAGEVSRRREVGY
jgi:hypothetical protein